MEDGADIGGEAGGKLRHTILADFNSDKFMSIVRVSNRFRLSALICISYNLSVSVCGFVSVVVGPVVDPSGRLSPIVSYIIGCGSEV